ncbi:MAG: trypsin-like peptidase domain-containing protein [Oscillospiraceae bacterium]|nr:trypsin-like peptidase domain-containing protein [Oscillospiraceae bacterium]
MYYEDENNLYHYSYRKGDKAENVRGGYEAPQPNRGEPWEEPKKKKKSRLGLKITALALVCALVGGVVGAGLGAWFMQSNTSTEIYVSNRKVAEVETVKVDGKRLLTMPEVYDANIESVVSINVSSRGRDVFGQVTESASAGSGFIITDDGYIVTNYHVVEGASKVSVTMYGGEIYEASIVGGDEDYDIAVIKIEGEGFPAVVIGDSGKLRIGETIAAIGNPLGELTFSMTQGIVSCVDRAINVDGMPFNMIQIDASINPGNSGGPLFNTYGEVIGIVSAKYSSYASTTVEGLGFAIPINDVSALIEDIMTNGFVTNKPYYGISAGTLTASMAAQYRYDIDEGAFVYSVDEGGAAEKAGLRMGDVITAVNDDEIKTFEDLTAVKKKYSAGDTVTLTVYRAGETMEVEFTFDATPAENFMTEEEEPVQQQPNNGYYYNPWNDFFNNMFGGFYGW